MFTEGIFPIGDGLLDIDEARLKSLLVQDDINEIYDVEQTPFARGKFAAVRRAVHKDSGVHFAAKFLKRRRRAQSSDKEIKHEIAVLTLCDGAENIVKLNAVHESRSDTALLLELATGGELQTFLDNEECLSEADARFCMREVLKGLQFLHKRSIAHLDLKPQNILLTGERIEDGLKLCDFGISRVVVEGTNVREIVGTPDYVAPEVLQYEPLSLLTDIWSVGVLAYVLLSGFSPFGGETKQETFLNISQCALTFPDKLFGGVSAAAIDFIRRALRIKPSDRMTAAGCLEHFWLKDDCSIDRHHFENGKSALATALDHDDDVDDDENDDDDEEEDIDDREEHDISIETDEADDDNDVEEEFETSSDENNSLNDDNGINDAHKMEVEKSRNGLMKKIPNGVDKKSSPTPLMNGITTASAEKTTKTTTVVHTVPAARATTIPLCHLTQQQHQQQHQHHQHQPINHSSRRHSTDSNKENTYLATKKIIPSNNLKSSSSSPSSSPSASTTAIITGTTRTITNKSTATIIIGTTDQQKHQQQNKHEQTESNNIIATISLPNGNGNSSSCAIINANVTAAPSLFPDAPTTPKVIRKAPNTDTSPTSVKALVKKFQLEGAEKHLKEAQSCNQQQQHQQQQQQPQQMNGGFGPRKSLPTLSVSNGKFGEYNSTKILPEKCTNGSQQHQSQQQQQQQQQQQYNRSNNSKNKHINNKQITNSSATTTNTNSTTNTTATAMNGHSLVSSNRRLSEPITAIHQQQKLHQNFNQKKSSSPNTPTSPLSTASDTVMNYKTTCVYCLTCGSSSSGSSNTTTTANGTTTNGTTGCGSSNNETNNVNGCRHSSMTTATGRNATAILLSSNHHHQHQHHLIPHHTHHPHHHHHHVVVAKNVAANNLSLDQGIIC